MKRDAEVARRCETRRGEARQNEARVGYGRSRRSIAPDRTRERNRIGRKEKERDGVITMQRAPR